MKRVLSRMAAAGAAIAMLTQAPGSRAAGAPAQDVTPPDWAFTGKPFPNFHPRLTAATPGAEGVLAQPHIDCGFCHMASGSGRPENAGLAGLAPAYIVQQVADIRSHARQFPDGPLRTMLKVAEDATPEEVEAAAQSFSKLHFVSHVTVREAADIPKAAPAVGIWRFLAGDEREPLGERIVEGPIDYERFEKRDPETPIVAYVPPGAVQRGKTLAQGGAACASCHGAGLKGGPIGPPLAGRSPTGLFRQLWSFKSGMRNGAGAALMKPVVAGLSQKDMIDLAAYAGTLTP
jgi:cytochrome c553